MIVEFKPDTDLRILGYRTPNLSSFTKKKKIETRLNDLSGLQSKIEKWAKIPDKLTESWNFPSPLTLAEASQIAYDFPTPATIDGWTLLCYGTNDLNHYLGVALTNNSSKQIIIAHRGTDTDSGGSIQADFNGVLNNQFTGQTNSACTFVLHILTELKASSHTVLSDIQLSITGHSLGGWLAQLTTYAAEYSQEDLKRSKFVNSSEGVHAHCVAFDSPGALQMLQKINRNVNTKHHHNNLIKNLDITVYLGKPNIVNVINEHLGRLIEIELTEKKDGPKGSRKKILEGFLNIPLPELHSLVYFVEALKKGAGKKLIIDWPLVIYNNWSTHDSKEKSPSKWLHYVKGIWYGVNMATVDSALQDFRDWNENKQDKRYSVENYDSQVVCLNIYSSDDYDFIHKLICWAKHFGGTVDRDLQKILDELHLESFDYEKRTIKVKSEKSVNIIFEAIRSSNGNIDTKLLNFKQILIFIKSKEYISQLNNRFIDVDIDDGKDLFRYFKKNGNIVISYGSKASSSSSIPTDFVRLKILSKLKHFVKKEFKSDLFQGEVLIVTADQINEIQNLSGLEKKNLISKCVKLLVVDCLDSTLKTSVIYPVRSDCRIIQVRSKEPSGINTTVIPFKINITEECLKTIMAQEVIFQKRPSHFLTVFPNMNVKNFNKYFTGDLCSLRSLITKDPRDKLEIGPPPPSFFKEKNNYVELEHLSIADFSKTFVHPAYFMLCGSQPCVKAIAKAIQALRPSRYLEIVSYIPKDSEMDEKEVLEEFYKLTKANRYHYVNLLECFSSEMVGYKLQYNPNLYKGRKFSEPTRMYEAYFNRYLPEFLCPKIQAPNIYDENELVEYFQKNSIIIVADEPGMGKSTSLKRISETFHEKHNDYLILWIDLKRVRFGEITSKNITLEKLLSSSVRKDDSVTNNFLKLELKKPFYPSYSEGILNFLKSKLEDPSSIWSQITKNFLKDELVIVFYYPDCRRSLMQYELEFTKSFLLSELNVPSSLYSKMAKQLLSELKSVNSELSKNVDDSELKDDAEFSKRTKDLLRSESEKDGSNFSKLTTDFLKSELDSFSSSYSRQARNFHLSELGKPASVFSKSVIAFLMLELENPSSRYSLLRKQFLKFQLHNPSSDSSDEFQLKSELWKIFSKVFVVFDGYDEVEGEFKSAVSLLLHELGKTATHFVVTTRSNLHELVSLRNALPNSASLMFEKLDDKEYTSFLVNFWKGVVQNKEHELKINEFADKAVEKAKEYLSHRSSGMDFFGVPLQLRMLSEVYLKHVKTFVDSKDSIDCFWNNLTDYNLLYLYNEYVDRKYSIFFGQKFIHDIPSHFVFLAKSNAQKLLEILSVKVLRYDRLAKLLCLTYDDILSPEIRNELCSTGIVHYTSADGLDFHHRTFAEFYFAKFLVRELREIISRNATYKTSYVCEVWTYLLSFVFQVQNSWVIRLFFNDLLRQEFTSADSQLKKCIFNDHASRKVNVEINKTFELAVERGIHEILPDYLTFLLNAIVIAPTTSDVIVRIIARNNYFPAMLLQESERENAITVIVQYLNDIQSNDNGDYGETFVSKLFEMAEAVQNSNLTPIHKRLHPDTGMNFNEDEWRTEGKNLIPPLFNKFLYADNVITFYKDKWLNKGQKSIPPPFKQVQKDGSNEKNCIWQWCRTIREQNTPFLYSIEFELLEDNVSKCYKRLVSDWRPELPYEGDHGFHYTDRTSHR